MQAASSLEFRVQDSDFKFHAFFSFGVFCKFWIFFDVLELFF